MNTYHKRHIEHNQHYKQHEHTIDSIQSALKREIPHLIQEFQLTALEVSSLNEFMDDRGKSQEDILSNIKMDELT